MLAAIDCDHLAGYRTSFKQILSRGGNVLGRGAAAQNRGRLLALEMGFALARIAQRWPRGYRIHADAGRETLFMPGREAIKLEPRDPVLYFIQRLRDEAHRFVIGSHRKLRKKDIREAGLQEIPGIGPSRKRALLHHFGTLKEIERASIADLGKVPGVSAESARKIFEFFHTQAG